jgi:hypothetical protein
MTELMRELADQIVRLQSALDIEIEKRRDALGWKVKDRFVEFEHGIVAGHRQLRVSVARYIAQTSPATILTAPVIYSLIVPLLMLDVWVSLYQAICFRVYRIAQVKRREFIAFDRGHLSYLNWIEALNCAFCAYGNGVIGYAGEISSRTEQYWCPIKHAVRISDPHKRYQQFLEYGDAEGYRLRLAAFREALKAEKPPTKQTRRSASR